MTDAAGALACPDCGAPASPDSTRCAYCGVALAVVACPNCLGRLFKGAKHCSHCGAVVGEPSAPMPTNLHCPRCKSGLVMVTVGTAQLGECESCGGTWVDARTFDQIVAEKEEQALVLAAALPGFKVKTAEARLERYWPCPACQALMNRVNFAHISGVVLDVCRAHGVWFDQDELRQLVEFIRSGGLERARTLDRAQPAPLSPPRGPAIPDYEDDRFEPFDLGDVLHGAVKVLEWILRR